MWNAYLLQQKFLTGGVQTFEAGVRRAKCRANRQTVRQRGEMSGLAGARQNGSQGGLPLLDRGGKERNRKQCLRSKVHRRKLKEMQTFEAGIGRAKYWANGQTVEQRGETSGLAGARHLESQVDWCNRRNANSFLLFADDVVVVNFWKTKSFFWFLFLTSPKQAAGRHGDNGVVVVKIWQETNCGQKYFSERNQRAIALFSDALEFSYYELTAKLMFDIRDRNAARNIGDLFQDISNNTTL